MGFLYSPLSLWVALGGWLAAAAVLGWVLWKKPFLKLNTDGLQHLWLSTVVTLSVLWAFDLWVQDGAVLHLLGATLLVTLFGWCLALVGSCVVIGLVALILGTPWQGVGMTMLALGIIPVLVSALVQALMAARLPDKRMSFVLGHGVFTSLIAVLASSGSVLAGHFLLRDISWNMVDTSFFTDTLVLAIGEAVFTGAMTAIIAVYKPAWMKTFDKRLNRIDR